MPCQYLPLKKFTDMYIWNLTGITHGGGEADNASPDIIGYQMKSPGPKIGYLFFF